MAINNEPTIQPRTVTGIFTNYIAKVLPLAFDDSMSYYECLCALLNYINDTIVPDINNTNDGLGELQEFYEELQSYVNNYFDNLDVQDEINNKLDTMAQDGSLSQLISAYLTPIVNAQNERIDNIETMVDSVASGSPLVASSTSGMTDTSRVYVNTSDGKWYYYNGTTWVIGGTYQSTGIADNSIDYDKLKNNILKSQNMKYLPTNYQMNSIEDPTGTWFYLYSTGKVGVGDNTRITNCGYMNFINNPVFKPIDNSFNYFINVYTQKSKQENTFDFTDLNLEQGSINSSGVTIGGLYHIRTSDYITVESDTLFEPDYNSYITYIFIYDSSNNFIERKVINDTSNIVNYTLTSSNKYKFVFQVGSSGNDISNNTSFFINYIKNSILTQMEFQVTAGWHDYTLTQTNNVNYLYKLCLRKKSGTFSSADRISDYLYISDNLTTPLHNKKVSVLGDSFSAYNEYIPSGNEAYYFGNNAGVTNYNEMWWQRLINNNGATRGVIQASSGSNVSYIREQNLCLSNTNMCQALDTPDVIIILGGTNDFSHTPALLGTYDGTGDFPTTNDNFSNAYALMLNRILTSYPNATVFCCGIPAFVRTNLDKTKPEQNTETNGEHKTIVDYSDKIKRIAEMFNCQYIDMNECGYNRTDYYPTYCQDNSSNSTHPNAKGQEVIFKCIEKKVLNVLSNLQ